MRRPASAQRVDQRRVIVHRMDKAPLRFLQRLADAATRTQLDEYLRDTGLFFPLDPGTNHPGRHWRRAPAARGSRPLSAYRFPGWLNDLALSMEGTCSGEHGVAQGKAKHLERELDPAMAIMTALKAATDPKGIMNPGKVLPTTDRTPER